MFLIADLAERVSTAQPDFLPGQCHGLFDIRSVTVWPTS
jgi:hypothetical protein